LSHLSGCKPWLRYLIETGSAEIAVGSPLLSGGVEVVPSLLEFLNCLTFAVLTGFK
jgi:hypothetical protein